ncbi:hypothetical protein CR203_19060 [Salipaludibacillus neizhouensis]|uniref:Uncharacterized protein n=1 Tax=Salipaludibacillus neizhouensis TaxID=885475 RepID=A0A3A9K023_9BACI|nr:hypothetical protein [Salipaludibacillus neizhouensis]RKL65749.1 hypothetical protein CR203_19060 [Salipaludibacillus neizhouensis]
MIQINSDQPNNTINPDVATSGNQESQAVSEDELFEKVIVHSETEIERLLIYIGEIGEGEANIDYGAPVNDIEISVEEN